MIDYVGIHSRLRELGLPIVGVCVDGRVDWEDGVTPTGEQISQADDVIRTWQPAETEEEKLKAAGVSQAELAMAIYESLVLKDETALARVKEKFDKKVKQ